MSAYHGIVRGLSAEEYHASPAISNTGLMAFGRSPAYYYRTHLDPKRPPPRPKAGQIEGTLAHCAILEPKEFDKRYVVGPTINRNTKQWKEWKEKAESDGRHAIQGDEYETAMAQAESVREQTEVRKALESGEPEVSVFWNGLDGALCRCRPDWMHTRSEGIVLLDVKTYSNADPVEFRLQIANKNYHQQAAWYTDGVEAVTGRPVLLFVFVAVETAYPYGACAIALDQPSVDEGRRLYRTRLARYVQCLAANEWPGYSDAIQIVSLPKYAFTEGARL